MAYMNEKKILQLVINNGGSESSTLITTTTDATLVSGSTYELALTYLAETPKVNDFIAYVNNGAITTLYKVTAVDSTNATLTKIGGVGKQLYQHNISIDNFTDRFQFALNVTIISDNNTPINTLAKLKQYLYDNNYISSNERLAVSGITIDTNNTTRIDYWIGIYCDDVNVSGLQCVYFYFDTKQLRIATRGLSLNNPIVNDKIVAL